jgi:predicted Rossmann fold flavoprotein
MAAGQAALEGADVMLLEKKKMPGRKLRITGKGRCNLTNIAEVSEFIKHFGRNGKFLRQSFARFFSSDLIGFFNEIGLATKIERGGRVFPENDRAQDVADALLKWISRLNVRLHTETSINKLITSDERITGAVTDAKRAIEAEAIIIATGGLSYPLTGSTGDGYHLAKSVGHTILTTRPSLVPLETRENFPKHLVGLRLKNVNAALYIDGRKAAQEFGEMEFTDFGLDGPIILTLSRIAVDALDHGREVEISIDLKPALDHNKLDARLLREIDQHGKMHFNNLLKELLPMQLIPTCMESVQIPPEKSAHQISSEERKRMRLWMKDFRLYISGHRSYDEAIITAGGVSLKEVNPRTMESRLIKDLYFCGEVLDLDGDTGGYNLQEAFSTGWLAGRSAAKADYNH